MVVGQTGSGATAVVGATVAATRRSAGLLVERDPEVDLDLPASDADVVDDEAEQLLALLEVELVDTVSGSVGEVTDSLLETVVDSELLVLCDQLVALAGQRLVADVDIPCSPLHFVQFEHPGLVEVGEASPLGPIGVEFAFQAGEFGGQELIVRGGRRRAEGCFARGEHLGAE